VVFGNGLSAQTLESLRRINLLCAGSVGGATSQVGEWLPPPVPTLLPCPAASDAVLQTWVMMMMTYSITRGLEIHHG